MFAKLLKYEWKATWPLISILSLALLGTGLLSGVAIRLSQLQTDNQMLEAILMIATILLLVFFFLTLICYGFATTLLILHRFYKNKFTDEGYLTFTLPVNSHQIFLSSWLNLLLWQILSMLVIMISILLAVGIGGIFPDDRTVFLDMQLMFRDASEILGESFGTLYRVLYPLNILTSWLYGSIMMLTCIVLGAAWAKKHKLLLAFALYYGLSNVVSVVVTILSVVLMLIGIDSADPTITVTATTLTTIVMCLVLSVGGYFLSTHMMSKRLNLS